MNNSLSNISNVVFKLLPGEYNVTSNIVIQHERNVSFGGAMDTSGSVVLKCFNGAFFRVICCDHVTVSNMMFDDCGGYSNWLQSFYAMCPLNYENDNVFHYLTETYSPSLHIACCSFISINNIIIKDHMEYGLIAYNLVGISKLYSITVYTLNVMSWGVLLHSDDNEYTRHYNDQNNTIVLTTLAMGIGSLVYTFANKAIEIQMAQSQYDITVAIADSVFDRHHITEPIIRIFIFSALSKFCEYFNHEY